MNYQRGTGCGLNALSFLTGVEANRIPLSKASIEDEIMVSYLRKKGFKTHNLTLCDLSKERDVINWNIHDDHVVLLSLLTCRGETSWMVLHQKILVHNFQTKALDPLEFLNNPIRSAYVVFHPSWKTADSNFDW